MKSTEFWVATLRFKWDPVGSWVRRGLIGEAHEIVKAGLIKLRQLDEVVYVELIYPALAF